MAEKEPIKVERLIAACEARVPQEVIYAATCVQTVNVGAKSTLKRSEMVPRVKLVSDADPELEVFLTIWSRGHDYYDPVCATIEARDFNSSSPSKLKLTVTSAKGREKNSMETTSETVERYLEFEERHDGIKFNLPLAGVRFFLVRLEVFTVFELSPITLNHTLNQARLRGDQHCDVLLCADGGELPAHRAVLAARSEVFAKMFGSPWKETQDGRVQFKDTPLAALELFLEFVYTNGIEVWEGLELELLDLGERYAMDDLKQECRLRLWTAKAPRALQLMQSNNPLVADMKKRFARIVMDNWHEMAKTSEWREFHADNPLALMVDTFFEGSTQMYSSTPAP